jgi:hypothetical protein
MNYSPMQKKYKKPRPVRELLNIMLLNDNLFKSGLCQWSYSLYSKDRITYAEMKLLTQYINDNKPSVFSSIDVFLLRLLRSDYIWLKGRKQVRVKWLKKHFRKLLKEAYQKVKEQL